MDNFRNKRVVVTGMGVVSPLGIGLDTNWEALMAGKSGVGPLTRFNPDLFKTKIAAEVKDFNPEDFMDKKAVKRLDIFVQYAVAAARMAMEQSRLNVTDQNSGMIGCIVGCGLGGLTTLQRTHAILTEKGPDRISPFFIPMLIGNMGPGQISIEFGLKGPNLCTSTACAAGTHAIGQALTFIRTGVCSAVLCGGVEAVITELAVSGFNAMKAISTRNDEPEKASRPFERDRDGFVIGEGSGMLVLEEEQMALERGANILAEVIGFGASGDAFHMTAPPEDGEGMIRCMNFALADAGLSPTDIDYINAHGTSTELNDQIESLAIKAVFGDQAYKVPISSTKSMTGHLLGGAGGVESIYSVLTIQNKVIPPTINYENQDPACDLDYVPNKPRPADVKIVMSNSFGFGGTNGALIFREYRKG